MINQFKEDLVKKGKPCEEEVLRHIRIWDKKAYLIDGYDSEKDIVSPLTGKTFEVKNCQDARVNVPIEIRIVNKNGEHLSGLSVTKATYWVIYCKEKFFMIKTETLKEIVRTIQPKEYTIHNQWVTLKILPIEQLKKNATHIWQ